MDNTDRLLEFIKNNPSNYHVIASQADRLRENGYTELAESEPWSIEKGGKYFVTRNGSAIIAFRVPEKTPSGFMIMASHSDSPFFKVKPGGEMKAAGAYSVLNTEVYGGPILYTWFDRPLSVAGRAFVRENGKAVMKTVNIDRDLLIIPSLAIHMDRDVNSGFAPNPQKDTLPLLGPAGCPGIQTLVAESLGVKEEDIISSELLVYNRTLPSRWGADLEYISSARLDDLECACASLEGFLSSGSSDAVAVHAVFDNEEVGSSTKQGAASTFLKDTLTRMASCLGLGSEEYLMMLSRSFMLSSDNAHAVHPNSDSKADPVNRPVPGEGVVLKFAGNQKYTTDAISEAVFRLLAEKGGVKTQNFANRSDLPGGSTLGNISGNQVAVSTADIGLAQLAMHSAYETAAAADYEELIKLARTLYSSSVETDGEYGYSLS